MTGLTTQLGAVLDASAVIAVIANEPGAEVVLPLLFSSAMSPVNLAEVLQWAARRGDDIDSLHDDLVLGGVRIVPYSRDHSVDTARLFLDTRRFGLSLGDRACLALARDLRIPVVTADRRWAELDVGVVIRLIR